MGVISLMSLLYLDVIRKVTHLMRLLKISKMQFKYIWMYCLKNQQYHSPIVTLNCQVLEPDVFEIIITFFK